MNGIAERKVIRHQTRHLLRELGVDADGVAAALAAEGVRGRPHNVGGCAMAVYVGAVLGSDRRVHSITVGNARLWIRTRPRWSRPIGVRLPSPVRQFIVAFDAGRFPRLATTTPLRAADRRPHAGPPVSASDVLVDLRSGARDAT
jgi:hypothetical protein